MGGELLHKLDGPHWEACDELHVFGLVLTAPEWGLTPPERQFRLLCAAALQSVRHHIGDERCRTAFELLEAHPDEESVLASAHQLAEEAVDARQQDFIDWIGDGGISAPQMMAERMVYQATTPDRLNQRWGDDARWVFILNTLAEEVPDRTPEQWTAFHLALFHDLFPNPFRPVAFAPAWFTPTVTALADAIYADRAWDRMPILADALEEAGCADARVLSHCRDYPVHARGCWVVDAILGKS